MTHAIQHTGDGFQYNWVIEALADYGAYVAGYENELEHGEIGCYHFLTDIQNRTHVYGCMYRFLRFVENKYDSQLVVQLHQARAKYSDDLLVQYTGKTFDQLANECAKEDSKCAGVFHGGL